MTMFAGAFALDSRHPIPGGCCETIRRILSRDPSDEVQVFRDGRSFLAKLDIGAFGQPAVQVGPNGAVSMLTGEPLLALDDDGRRTRQDDLGLLHQEWLGGRWELLRKARGLFSAVHYDPVTPSLSLIADKLAIRPLYYWVGERHVVFSTAIRVLEELDLVPKVMDFRGVTEIAYVHYPLSRRTGYADIHTVRPSERVTVSEGGLERSVYWRWDEIEPFGGPETEMVQEGYRRFRSAVRCRIREDTSALALLSGGLDSRSVVGMLRDLDVDVHTYNFAPPRTQDRAFGREFARRVGTYHEEITLSSDWADTNAKVRQLAQAWAESPGRKERPPERPMLEWGGVGGSFGLGHIYLNQQLIDLLRAGDRDAVVRRWMGRGRVIRKLMQPEAFKIAGEVLRQGIREELDEVHCPDPARDYYLFIMFNDQRHLLYDYFENLDVYRLDVQMPFFDSEFLAWIMAIPIDLCLRHEYYMRWLGLFPRALTAVPWQAYPGHVPCPIPFDETLRGQWDEGRSSQTPDAQKRRLLGVAREILGEKAFPRPLLRKSFLRLATLAYRAGVRDYGYVIRAAAPYCRYWVAADGEYVLPPTAA